jgi:hypothetical protein
LLVVAKMNHNIETTTVFLSGTTLVDIPNKRK